MQNSTGKAWAAHLPSKASGPKEAGQADGRMLARGRFDPFTTPSGNDRIYALRSCTASSSHEQQSPSGHRRKARDGFFLPFASTSGPRRAACPTGYGRSRSSPPLEHRLAPVIDTYRAPLRAVRNKRREQIGELGVPTVLPHEPLDVVPLAPPARFADDRQERTRISDRRVAPSRGIVRNIVSCLSLLRNLGVVNEIHKC